MESPLRFQAVMAALAIGGAVLFVQSGDDPPRPEPVFTFQDDEIDESSGLVDLGDSVLTVNDSGGGPVVHRVDRESGETTGRTTYTSDEVVDVEALAVGPDGQVWVGDIGDNNANRLSVAVYRLPPVEPGERSVGAERFDLQYRNGPRDAETLLVHPQTGRLYVVSKGLFGGQVFAAPEELRTDEPNLMKPVGRTGGLVTDGAFLPDGRHAVLRTYSTASVHDAATWTSLAGMTLPEQRQGEGIAISGSGERVLVSTEGAGTEVLSVPLSLELLAALAGEPTAEPPEESEAPAPVQEAAQEPVQAPEAAAEDDDTAWLVAGAVIAVVSVAALGKLLLLVRSRRQSRSTT